VTLVCVGGGVFLSDLLSKLWIVAHVQGHRPIKLLGGLVYLIHTRNTGAAFSLASGYTALLSIVAIGVVIFAIAVARRLTNKAWGVSLGLIVGGALGNICDRIFRDPAPLRGGVVDFISLLDPINPPWPVFNLADSALVIGVGLAVLLELRGVAVSGGRRSRREQVGDSVG
jgi:signal peptidase II